MSERQLLSVLAGVTASAGVDRLGYAIVVAGTGNPLLGSPSERVWGSNDLLLVDVGVVVSGYWADYSRHFAAAEPAEPVREAYALIVSALEAGRRACRPGATAAMLAAAMTAELDGAEVGFGRVGHGIGLEITEPPSLYADDESTLLTGMTLCLEPGARFEGVGQLVGEETVVLTEDGCELISPPFPPEMTVVG